MMASSIPEMAAELGVEEEEYRSLLRLFAKSATKEIGAIKTALQANDREEIARLAHSLKGATVSLGLADLSAVAAALEQGAREGASGELASLALTLEGRLAHFERLIGDDFAADG